VTSNSAQVSLVAYCRSLLFVPGNRPERYRKALAAGADLICIDLEDAVGPGSAKDDARRMLLGELPKLLDEKELKDRIVLRINSLKTGVGLHDIQTLQGFSGWLPPIVVPKVDAPADLHILDNLLRRANHPEPRFLPMIETPRALEAAAAIACALPPTQLLGLLIGCVDLSLELGCALEWEPMLYARSRVVHAAALAGVGAIDSPNLDVTNPAALEEEARRAARLGFSGKSAIHPSQIAPIHRAFAPSEEQVKRARAVVDAYDRMSGGVALLDGKLIERPVYMAAKQLLANDSRRKERRSEQ
jgi:citrate lyase beta subunit